MENRVCVRRKIKAAHDAEMGSGGGSLSYNTGSLYMCIKIAIG
jgi:hypothetical protein